MNQHTFIRKLRFPARFEMDFNLDGYLRTRGLVPPKNRWFHMADLRTPRTNSSPWRDEPASPLGTPPRACWPDLYILRLLLLPSEFRESPFDHGKNEFASGSNQVNGIENFQSIARTRFAKFRGIHKPNFYLHLKKYEFSINHHHEKLYGLLLKIFRNKPLPLP